LKQPAKVTVLDLFNIPLAACGLLRALRADVFPNGAAVLYDVIIKQFSCFSATGFAACDHGFYPYVHIFFTP
jgi:hypothetical protein